MTGALRSKSVGGAIALAGVAALAVVVLVGIAAVVLGAQCSFQAAGPTSCFASTDPIVTATIEPTTAAGYNVSTVVMTTAPVASPGPAKKAVAPPPANDLVDATFDLLVADVEPSPAVASSRPADEAAAAGEVGASPPAAPLWTAVKPLAFPQPAATAGRMIAPVPATRAQSVRAAYAEASVEEAVPAPDSAAAAVTSLADDDPVTLKPEIPVVPATRSAALAEEAPAAGGSTNSDKRIVGGSGVNVRSGPSKSSSRLFALAAGQEVTITGDDKDWLQVVDAKGRKGWIYKTYLTSPD